MLDLTQGQLLTLVVLVMLALVVAERLFSIRQMIQSVRAVGQAWDRDRAEAKERLEESFKIQVNLREKLEDCYEILHNRQPKKKQQQQIPFKRFQGNGVAHTLNRDPSLIQEQD